MTGKPTPSPPMRPPRLATGAEIEQAINALTTGDTQRIDVYARNRIVRVRWSANGRSHEDLIQEAFTRMIDGARHWYPDSVSFTQCLIGAIRSIASEWAGHRKRNKTTPEYASTESDLVTTGEEGKTNLPFNGLQDSHPNVEEEFIEADMAAAREAEAKALADKIEAAFADDENASIVLMGFQDGMDGPAIRAGFDLSEKEFRTTTRRIQRRVEKIMDEHHGK